MNKILVVLLVLATSPLCLGQMFPPEPSVAKDLVKLCSEINGKAKIIADQWNHDHPLERLSLDCSPVWGWKESVVNKRHFIPLTPEEKDHYKYLDYTASEAFKAEDSYEKYLLYKHGVTHWQIPGSPDPCWRYAGIVVNTDYITVESLPPNCSEK